MLELSHCSRFLGGQKSGVLGALNCMRHGSSLCGVVAEAERLL